MIEEADNPAYFKCTCHEYGSPLYWTIINGHLLSIPDAEFLSHFADKHIMEALADV